MVSSGECATDEVATDKLQSPDAGSNPLEQSSESKICLSQADQGGGTPSTKLEKAPVSDSGVQASQSLKGGKVSSVITDKTSTPDTTASPFLVSQASSPIAREKVSEDGYNWRKYGQKLVKGNEFVRSYYKCTHPNCLVKKQLERSHDGKMVDTVYFGQHEHPKPLNLPLPVGFAVSVVEEKPDNASPTIVKDKSTNAHIQSLVPLAVVASESENVKVSTPKSSKMHNVAESDDDHLIAKRRKKENSNMDASLAEKPTSESRMVIKTLSEVDIVNDGYRWRKYGQKLVKGNPNPRSYYRCSSPGCPVKKHVERASHDAKLVITTYEGRHDHDIPPTRTVTHNTTGSHVNSTAHNDESSTKVEESEPASIDMVVYSGSGPDNKSTEQLNGESTTMSEVSATVVDKSMSGPETGSNEQKSRNLDSSKVSDVGHDTMGQSKLSPQTTSKEQLSSKVETKSENDTVCIDKIVHVPPHPECNFDEQRMPSAEPVQS